MELDLWKTIVRFAGGNCIQGLDFNGGCSYFSYEIYYKVCAKKI